jgi:hypothetical protein
MNRRLKLLTAYALVALLALPGALPVSASSHREAPLITADPLADNTDVYAFRSTEAGREGFVTLIANYVPFQEPGGGPHFYKFDDTVIYAIKVDNTGDGVADIAYEFRFTSLFPNPDTVLGMATGPITSLTDPDYTEPQTYSITRVAGDGTRTLLADGLRTPPSNIGARTTPNYETVLAQSAVYPVGAMGGRVFAGQRDEGFYVNVEGVFDTLNLPVSEGGGIDTTAGFNVNTIAIEVPVQALTRGGTVPSGPTAANAVIGVWATASRAASRTFDFGNGRLVRPSVRQVSRLGSPLVNEVVIPLGRKDAFNASEPRDDAQFAPFVVDPQLAQLLVAVFGISVPPPPRQDLVFIFATGIPVNPITGPNFTTFLSDGQPHEMMRLNVAIPPTPAGSRSRLGLLGGDVAGYPNGRRVGDDVTDISLRAVAGGTPFTPAFNIAPNNALGDGVPQNDVAYLDRFPYLGTPHAGNIDGRTAPHEHHKKN